MCQKRRGETNIIGKVEKQRRHTGGKRCKETVKRVSPGDGVSLALHTGKHLMLGLRFQSQRAEDGVLCHVDGEGITSGVST